MYSIENILITIILVLYVTILIIDAIILYKMNKKNK